MGTWGTGIYSSDAALDVKDDYHTLLEVGFSDEDALIEVLKESPSPGDDDECEFWTALAYTLWKDGRPNAAVIQKALDIIEQGGDLYLWEEAGNTREVKKRQKALEDLKICLLSDAPPRKKLKPFYYQKTTWNQFDVILYQISEKSPSQEYRGKWIAFHITKINIWKNTKYSPATDSHHVDCKVFDAILDSPDITPDDLKQCNYVVLAKDPRDRKPMTRELLWNSQREIDTFCKRTVTIGQLICTPEGGFTDPEFRLKIAGDTMLSRILEHRQKLK